MRFDVISIFPQIFGALKVSKIWQDAQEKSLLELHVHDLRKFCDDVHRKVDDIPYGGGAGMVMKVEPLANAVESISRLEGSRVIYASPHGRHLTQALAEELATCPQLIFVAGRYEGVDERFVEGWVDESISIGDYVLSGGELPIMVCIEAIARLIPGVVGDVESVKTDSFSQGSRRLLKHPQYTRPAEFRGIEVPEVLRSGNHAAIEAWRRDQSVKRTEKWHPELLDQKSQAKA
jgi:tRNA (guanine37-N1)-methyltransferase